MEGLLNDPQITAAKFISWAGMQGIELHYLQLGKPN